MTTPTVSSRDPKRQFWVQSTKPELEGKLGSAFALSNGHLGLRGAHEEMPVWGRPEFYIAGTYTGGPPSLLGFHDPDHILTHPARRSDEILKTLGPDSIPTLPNLPNPTALKLTVGGIVFSHERSKILSNERLLEMQDAVLRRRLVFRDAQDRKTCIDSRRLVSMADRHLICLEYRVTPLEHAAPIAIEPYLKKDVTNPNGVVLWTETRSLALPDLNAIVCRTNQSGIEVAIAQHWTWRQDGAATVLELFVAAGELALDEAVRQARASAAHGFAACLDAHRAAWQRETDGGRIDIGADVSTSQGLAFGQMHLHMAFCYGNNRVGIPIKGLTGHGYRFANFWDMDFHMFPYFLMLKPRESRLLLEYRYNQLDRYRENARIWGASGAQVPWETQVDGREVTAPWLCLQEREIHISADAAYMFKLYDELTPDHACMVDMGAEFILETARYYASRIKWHAGHGRYELPDIGCPDQYHTFADNNVFISMMARWNVEYAITLAADPRYGAAVTRIGLTPAEIATWKKMMGSFYVIGPNAEGIIEEFDGFFGLSPDMDGICETFCRHSQAVKQPDVLAAFIPFEDHFGAEVRRKNWRFYAARTLHGSSLSLPGMAYSAARCGLNDEALDYLHKSTRMDLDDVNMDTERGVHVSASALQWYTVVFGFAGLTPRRECLAFEPNLPRQWRHIEFTTHWQFQRLRVRLDHERIAFTADAGNTGPIRIKLGAGAPFDLPPGQTYDTEPLNPEPSSPPSPHAL
jgi:kojibiose phosphorylase